MSSTSAPKNADKAKASTKKESNPSTAPKPPPKPPKKAPPPTSSSDKKKKLPSTPAPKNGDKAKKKEPNPSTAPKPPPKPPPKAPKDADKSKASTKKESKPSVGPKPPSKPPPELSTDRGGKSSSSGQKDSKAIYSKKKESKSSVNAKLQLNATEAAAKIQAVKRGQNTRKAQREKHEASKKIQALQRGRSQRKKSKRGENILNKSSKRDASPNFEKSQNMPRVKGFQPKMNLLGGAVGSASSFKSIHEAEAPKKPASMKGLNARGHSSKAKPRAGNTKGPTAQRRANNSDSDIYSGSESKQKLDRDTKRERVSRDTGSESRKLQHVKKGELQISGSIVGANETRKNQPISKKVNGVTTSKMKNKVIQRFVKKVGCRMLPPLNSEGLKIMFSKYDTHGFQSLGANELLKWMRDLNKDPSTTPSMACAEELIKIHDQNNDHKLQYNELEEWLSKGSKLSRVKRNELRGKSDTFRHSTNFLENVVRHIDRNTSEWTFKAKVSQISGMKKADNPMKSCSVKFSLDGEEIARTKVLTGKINPSFESLDEILAKKTLLEPFPTDDSNYPWMKSTLRIQILSNDGQDSALATSHVYSGNELISMISHQSSSDSAEWRPAYTTLTLKTPSKKRVKVRLWVWVQPCKMKKKIAASSSGAGSILGVGNSVNVNLQSLVMNNVAEKRKQRVERARKNASVEKKKKLDEKAAKRRQRNEEISRRRKARYLMQLKSEMNDIKRSEEVDEAKVKDLEKQLAKAEAEVTGEKKPQQPPKTLGRNSPTQQAKKAPVQIDGDANRIRRNSKLKPDTKPKSPTAKAKHSVSKSRLSDLSRRKQASVTKQSHAPHKAPAKRRSALPKHKKVVDMNYINKMSSRKEARGASAAKKLEKERETAEKNRKAERARRRRLYEKRRAAEKRRAEKNRKEDGSVNSTAERRETDVKKGDRGSSNSLVKSQKKHHRIKSKKVENMGEPRHNSGQVQDEAYTTVGTSVDFPIVDFEKVHVEFQKFDASDKGKISIDDLLLWMLALHNCGSKHQLQRDNETTKPNLDIAKGVVDLVLNESKSCIQFSELKEWVVHDHTWWNSHSQEERENFCNISQFHHHRMDFIFRLCETLHRKVHVKSIPHQLPALNIENLKWEFEKYDEDADKCLNPTELNKWMLSVHSSVSDEIQAAKPLKPPDLKIVKAIISAKILGQKDKKMDNMLQFSEFKQWLEEDMKLWNESTPTQRRIVCNESNAKKYSFSFSEKVIRLVSKPCADILPPLNTYNLRRAFAQYDIDNHESIDKNELHKWMVYLWKEENESKKKKAKKPTKKSANYIVTKNDDSSDKALQYNEFRKWITDMRILWNESGFYKRREYIAQGAKFRDSVAFVERVVKWADRHSLDDWLPELDTQKFEKAFKKYAASTDEHDSLSADELLAWMVDFTSEDPKNKKLYPSLKAAKGIIKMHEKTKEDGLGTSKRDGKLELIEFRRWMFIGAHMPKDQRIDYKKKSKLHHISMTFLEQVVQKCEFQREEKKSDWMQLTDPHSKLVYYLNRSNGVTSRKRPSIMAPPPLPPPPPSSSTSGAMKNVATNKSVAKQEPVMAPRDQIEIPHRVNRRSDTDMPEHHLSERLEELSIPNHATEQPKNDRSSPVARLEMTHRRSPSATFSNADRGLSPISKRKYKNEQDNDVRRKVDMNRINRLANPIVHKENLNVVSGEKVLPVGSRKKHTKASINKQIKRQADVARRREEKMKLLRAKLESDRAREEMSDCTFKPKLNKKNAWKKSTRKPLRKKKPKTVTEGRRIVYKKYNPNGHLAIHDAQHVPEADTKKAAEFYDRVSMPPTPPVKEKPRARRRILDQQRKKYREFQEEQLKRHQAEHSKQIEKHNQRRTKNASNSTLPFPPQKPRRPDHQKQLYSSKSPRPPASYNRPAVVDQNLGVPTPDTKTQTFASEGGPKRSSWSDGVDVNFCEGDVQSAGLSVTKTQVSSMSGELGPRISPSKMDVDDTGTTKEETLPLSGNFADQFDDEVFNEVMRRGEIAAQSAASARDLSDLLNREAADIRLSATVDRAGRVRHLINADRISRYETTLARTLTDDRPPHRQHNHDPNKFSTSKTIARHPVYHKARRSRRPNRKQINTNPRKAKTRHLSSQNKSGFVQRNATSYNTNGTNMPLDIHVHIDTDKQDLENKILDSYGRIELLQKLEFDLMRQEFGTAITKLSDQVQSRIKNIEKEKSNAFVVNQIRQREERIARKHREKMEALKASKPPRSTLKRAQADLSLLKQGALVPTPEMLGRIMMEEELQEEERLTKRARTLRGANIIGRETDPGEVFKG